MILYEEVCPYAIELYRYYYYYYMIVYIVPYRALLPALASRQGAFCCSRARGSGGSTKQEGHYLKPSYMYSLPTLYSYFDKAGLAGYPDNYEL